MSRLFEDAYQERYTASTVLSTIGGESSAASTSASTRHLAMGVDQRHDRRSRRAPVAERVEVFMKPFRLRQDVTLLATPEAQKLLSALSTAAINGALEYQAGDDKVCFNPERVPVTFTVTVKGLDRRVPPPSAPDSFRQSRPATT